MVFLDYEDEMSPILRAHHSSLLGKRLPRVNRMESIKLPSETRQAFEEMALGIFTDMSNASHSFQSSLLAIYLSGLHHGSALQKQSSGND